MGAKYKVMKERYTVEKSYDRVEGKSGKEEISKIVCRRKKFRCHNAPSFFIFLQFTLR